MKLNKEQPPAREKNDNFYDTNLTTILDLQRFVSDKANKYGVDLKEIKDGADKIREDEKRQQEEYERKQQEISSASQQNTHQAALNSAHNAIFDQFVGLARFKRGTIKADMDHISEILIDSLPKIKEGIDNGIFNTEELEKINQLKSFLQGGGKKLLNPEQQHLLDAPAERLAAQAATMSRLERNSRFPQVSEPPNMQSNRGKEQSASPPKPDYSVLPPLHTQQGRKPR